MQIKLTADIYVKGKPYKKGKVLSIDEETAKELIGANQAEAVKDEPKRHNK